MHVLLIEPDAILGQIYAEALIRAGHTVGCAVSAQSAIQLADEHIPDAVVLELQLPRHNGVEFLYEFRSYSEWLHVPIVLHTCVPPTELAHAATLRTELGVCRVLHKPATSLQQLCAAVQSAHSSPQVASTI